MPVTVRVHEMGVDPAGAGRTELANIELTRGDQHLTKTAFDGVAINVGIHVDVGAQRLNLRDGVVEGAPVPEADIIKHGLMLAVVDGRFGDGFERGFFDARVEGVGGAGGVDVVLDVGAFEGELVGTDVERADQSG